MGSVPDPTVPARTYDEAYYRESCAGFAEWVASEGRHTSGIYPGVLRRAQMEAGEIVVDLGTGRGELVAVAVAMGAGHAYGIEYSMDAVRLAQQTLKEHGVQDRAEVVLADTRSPVLPSSCADLVTMIDVVEHLAPDELHATLREAHRLLKPWGRIVAHTAPNRLAYNVTYRVLRWTVGIGRWPRDPRGEREKVMHINEQSLRSLKRAFVAAGFHVEVSLGEWIHTGMVPNARAARVYHALGRVRLLARSGVFDLWAFGREP